MAWGATQFSAIQEKNRVVYADQEEGTPEWTTPRCSGYADKALVDFQSRVRPYFSSSEVTALSWGDESTDMSTGLQDIILFEVSARIYFFATGPESVLGEAQRAEYKAKVQEIIDGVVEVTDLTPAAKVHHTHADAEPAIRKGMVDIDGNELEDPGSLDDY